MRSESFEGLQEFLQETSYCDINHPEIRKLAKEFTDKHPEQKQRAITIFRFVRDEIKYRLGSWNKKASQTLAERKGMCTNSSNLLVALMRASGIPAGYCIYRVTGGESFGHILPRIIKQSIDKDSVHIITYAYVNGRWVKCDASTDREFSDKTRHISDITRLIDWDGEHDEVHLMPREHILSESEPIANVDFQLDKKPRYLVKHHVFHVGNLFIDFLRNRGPTLKDSQQVEKEFEAQLKKDDPIRFFLLKINSLKPLVFFKKSTWNIRIWIKEKLGR